MRELEANRNSAKEGSLLMLAIDRARPAIAAGSLEVVPGTCRPNGKQVLLAVLAVAVLASCDGSSQTTAAPGTGSAVPTSSSSAATSAGSAASGQAAVEAAYRAFWPVLSTFAREPEVRWRSVLARVTAEPQTSLTIALTHQQKRNGIAVYGQPTPRTPKVTAVSVRAATVEDCADFSRAGQVDVRTGQRKTVGVARNPVVVRLSRGGDGRWRVAAVTYPGGRC